MIEQAIVFCIGFLTAALLAVAAAPAISRRARRLAEARARLQAPLTEAQAIAERDALRAQNAVEQFRLEQRLSAAEDTAARRWIDLGRQATRIVALEEAAGQRADEIAAQRAEVAACERDAHEARAELGAVQLALSDLTFQRDAAERDFGAARARQHELRNLADQHRATIAALQTRLASLEVRLADSEREAAAAAKAVQAEKARLAAELDDRAAAARARLAETEALLSRSEAAREAALLENGRQLARLAERDAALREAEATKRDLADQLGLLGAAHVIAEGALGAERAERAELQRQADPLRARRVEASPGARGAGDQALRKAIARLARDMARLNDKERRDETARSNLVNFDRRDPHAHAVAANETLHSAPVGKIRQGQPMAPER